MSSVLELPVVDRVAILDLFHLEIPHSIRTSCILSMDVGVFWGTSAAIHESYYSCTVTFLPRDLLNPGWVNLRDRLKIVYRSRPRNFPSCKLPAWYHLWRGS